MPGSGSIFQKRIQPLLEMAMRMSISVIALGFLVTSIVAAGCSKKVGRDAPAGMVMEAAPKDAGRKDDAKAEKDATPRKIIYTATIRLIVEDFTKAEEDLITLVKNQKGYVISSEVTGTPGTPRSGQWKVRVPVERFEEFRAEAVKLGKLERSAVDSQDVTDEYYDLEARIKNKKVEEARLIQHLKSTGKLEDILAVEREISRVRGEIERQQGRLQLLAKLTAMTTITIFINERTGYVPAEAESFGTTVSHTFENSLGALTEFGKNLVLLAVAIAPWLVPLAVVALPVGIWRWRKRAAVK